VLFAQFDLEQHWVWKHEPKSAPNTS
jgi:hypothetical protein